MKNSFRKELLKLRANHPLVARIRCDDRETEIIKKLSREKFDELPSPIVIKEEWEGSNRKLVYYRIENDAEITDNERIEYILLQQEAHLRSIRKMLCFFVTLACIAIAAGIAAIVVPLL